MNKIAYALVCYNAANSGVYKKILDQVTAWKSAGYAVRIFVITDENSRPLWEKIDPTAVILIDSNPLVKLLNRLRILRLASKSQPSIIYLRDSFPIWLPVTSAPIVVEIQSLVGQELTLRSRKKYLAFSILKKVMYSRISGAIYVTRELMNTNEVQLRQHIPKIAIGNGINLSRIKSLPVRSQEKPALFFVGSPNQPWHGVQELVEFGNSNSDVDIHIVGTDGVNIEPNIFFHGTLNETQYQLIASRCQAGVGSLKLSTNQMREASPLKVREYLAFGLPVILKYRDTDLSSGEDYILEIPPDPQLLSDFSLEIHVFLQKWSAQRVPRERIQHLDVSAKEQVRIGFFEVVLSGAHNRGNQESNDESEN